MGSAFGRLITEAMLPLVSRILTVMDQEALIDLPLKVDGQQVKIVPVSPLAKAQNLEELETVLQFAQVAQQFGPTGAMAINQERAISYIADRLGVPARVLATEDERAEIMRQMETAAAQMIEQQEVGAAPQ